MIYLASIRLLFQFTHPVWGATVGIIASVRSILMFQFTHPVWGATQQQEQAPATPEFQFTHPVWGATYVIV